MIAKASPRQTRLHSGLRQGLGKWSRSHPLLRRLLLALYHFYHFEIATLPRRLARLGRGEDAGNLDSVLGRQRVRRFPVAFEQTADADSFRDWLRDQDLTFREGRWTFYLPPQPKLAQIAGFMGACYPPGSGLKILKDFRPPQESHYTYSATSRAPGAERMRARTPSPQALLRVANYLYTNDLGVRVWDLIELSCEGRGLTAYVVEHLSGPAPSHANHAAFLRRLTDLCQSGPLETPHGKFERAADFAAPNCNGNLLVDQRSGAALYVDFQGFQLIDERKILLSRAEHARSWSHFGGTRLRRGNRPYLYQALPGLVPGKRDTASRWQLFHEILAKSEIDLEGRVVFDVGCNMGLMLYGALSEGALWACGWDMPDVVKEARGLLFSLGATRFTLTPGVITDQTDFAAGLPPHLTGSTEGVLFYLAVYRHIGFPQGLARLPWRYMVFEGHGDEDLENVLAYVNRIPCLEPVEVLSSRMVADGDSPPRPLLLVRRSG